MFYVYEWYIKDTNEIIYVGKGHKNRYKVRKHNRFFNDMIKRYECESRIIKTFEKEEDAFEYEFIRINELRQKNQCVCNIYQGGFGGTTNWWTDEKRKQYSKNNVMKSENQRQRMKNNNPMSNPLIAEKTNGQKRIPVIINDKRYISIKQASIEVGVSTDTIARWCKQGHSSNGTKCFFEKRYARQSATKLKETNKSILEGSTTNE